MASLIHPPKAIFPFTLPPLCRGTAPGPPGRDSSECSPRNASHYPLQSDPIPAILGARLERGRTEAAGRSTPRPTSSH